MRRKLLGLAAAIAMTVGAGPALAMDGFIVTYYADAGHTIVIGYSAVDCTGYQYVYGSQAGYAVVQTWHC